MGFSRYLLCLVFGMIPFFLFSGCGDLEPEMQDTRSVVLKMNFNQRSSSRSPQISQAEVSKHKTHLILALPAWEQLSSSYRNYYSSFAQELMKPSENKVSLEIPLNTQMRIFAFLFSEDYTMPQLLSGVREVGYYGQSQPFSINANTNNLRLNITLQSAGTTDGDNGDGDFEFEENDGGSDGGNDNQAGTEAPFIDQVTAVASPTSDSTPNYTFASTVAGTITYGGSCSSGITSSVSGNNTITFIALSDGTYSDCTIKVTDYEGNVSNTLTIPAFTIDTTPLDTTAPTVTFSPGNGTSGIGISDNITITFSEAVRNIDNTVLTNSNINSHITLKYNNSNGSDNITFDASINTEKTVITINPVSNLFDLQTVYVAIGTSLEDQADNQITAVNATFTTGIDPSLEAFYQFNGNANDESGNSYHGQLGDNVTTSKFPTKTTDRYGNADKAFSFDGNDYIALNKYVTFNSISEITVCAWTLSTNTSNNKFIISFDRSESFRLSLNNGTGSTNPNVGWDTTDSDNITNDLGSPSSYEDGIWHHICGWYKSSAISDDKKIFVDGVKVAPVSSSNAHSGMNLGTNRRAKQYGFIGWGSEAPSFDGNGNVHSADFMIGKIDDVRIYNRALSESEISALYLREKP